MCVVMWCTHACRTGVNNECLSRPPLCTFINQLFETGPLSERGAHHSTMLAGQWAVEICLTLSPSSGFADTQCFRWMLSLWPGALLLEQAPFWLSISSTTWCLFVLVVVCLGFCYVEIGLPMAWLASNSYLAESWPSCFYLPSAGLQVRQHTKRLNGEHIFILYPT